LAAWLLLFVSEIGERKKERKGFVSLILFFFFIQIGSGAYGTPPWE
jgi:hypothetical protein